jgi:hypothetical protein
MWPGPSPSGPRRLVCFVDVTHFVHGPVLDDLMVFRAGPGAWPSWRRRPIVLGALDAVTRELTTVINDTVVNAEVACEVLLELSARLRGCR